MATNAEYSMSLNDITVTIKAKDTDIIQLIRDLNKLMVKNFGARNEGKTDGQVSDKADHPIQSHNYVSQHCQTGTASQGQTVIDDVQAAGDNGSSVVEPITPTAWLDAFKRELTPMNKAKLISKYGDRIVELNREHTQKEIAGMLGVSTATINHFLSPIRKERKARELREAEERDKKNDETYKKVLEKGPTYHKKPEVCHDIFEKEKYDRIVSSFPEALKFAGWTNDR